MAKVAKPPIKRIQLHPSDYEKGRRFKISQISEHHAVGDAEHVIGKAKSAAVFSCTFTIGTDGTIYQLVDIKDTPYTDNDWRSNGRSITIEHAGGGKFPYTKEMYKSSIKLHAWLFQEYGNLKPVRHRDIPEIKADPRKATACSGDLNVEHIVSEAKKLLKGEGDEMLKNQNHFIVMWRQFTGREPSKAEIKGYVGRRSYAYTLDKLNRARKDLPTALKQLEDLRKLADELNKRPTVEAFTQLRQQVIVCEQQVIRGPEVEAEPDEPDQPNEPHWITKFFAALFRKKG